MSYSTLVSMNFEFRVLLENVSVTTYRWRGLRLERKVPIPKSRTWWERPFNFSDLISDSRFAVNN